MTLRDLDVAVSLLRQCDERLRTLLVAHQVTGEADFLALGDLDGRIRAFLADHPPAPVVPRVPIPDPL